jgi:hypothetical protein
VLFDCDRPRRRELENLNKIGDPSGAGHESAPRDQYVAVAGKKIDVAKKRYIRACFSKVNFLISDLESKILECCKESGTLKALTERCCKDLGVDESLTSQIETVLKSLIDKGLLISVEKILNSLKPSANDREQTSGINTIAVLTCDRPNILSRAINSYIQNLNQFGRQARLVIVDDSKSKVSENANLQTLKQIKTQNPNISLFYMSRTHRRNLAQQLAKRVGLPLSTLEFCLLGTHPEINVNWTGGAGRNALIFETIGERFITADDDVIFQAVPLGNGENIGFGGKRPSRVIDWIGGPDEVQKFAGERKVPLDLIGTHESILGSNPGRYLKKQLQGGNYKVFVDQLGSAALTKFSFSESRIVSTRMGVLGDAGIGSTTWYLLSDPQTLDILLADERKYESVLRGQMVLSGSKSTFITSEYNSFSMCIGMDNTVGLPPYNPIFRGEDDCVAGLMRLVNPAAHTAFLPYSVVHLPYESRILDKAEVWTKAVDIVTSPDFLLRAYTSQAFAPSYAPGNYFENLGHVGESLLNLADPEQYDLHDFARTTYIDIFKGKVEQIENMLNGGGKSLPEYYQNDLMHFRNALFDAFNERDDFIPTDMNPGTGTENRLAGSRAMLRVMAEIMIHWGELIAEVKKMKEESIAFAELVEV